MQSIRFGLQRHFVAKNDVDIINNKDFAQSNKIFKAMLKTLKAEGKASVKHYPPISPNDMDLIGDSLSGKMSTARGLQQKVFVDVMVYFCNRGMENLRQMKKTDFIHHPESTREREYYTLRDMQTKNHADDDEESQGGRMYATPGNPGCPVSSLKKYLQKLNQSCEFMWQRPKKLVKDDNALWYDNVPLGRDTLSAMAKNIAREANCSKEYTNHCLRATSVTILDHSGFASRDIMTVSGHKSETSIKNYAHTSNQQKEKMSDKISEVLNFKLKERETAHEKFHPEVNVNVEKPSSSNNSYPSAVKTPQIQNEPNVEFEDDDEPTALTDTW